MFDVLKPVSPWLIITLPLVALPVKILSFRKEKIRNILVLMIAVLTFLMVLSYYPLILKGEIITQSTFLTNKTFNLFFRVDAVGFLFAIISSSLWIFTIIYSFGYMKESKNKNRYFTFLTLSLGFTMGIAFSGNLITFYTFYELLTLATYPLVVHFQTPEALKAGKKYLIYSLSGAALILMAIMFISSLTGTTLLSFTPDGIISGEFVASAKNRIELILLLFLLGFSVKAAIMPLHGWLPAAMVAPTPISALFHAVAIVNSGVFGIIRIVYFIYGQELILSSFTGKIFLALVLVTIIAGSIMAFYQDNLKKRLAYSTISQLGYISLGAFLLNPEGLAGGIFHIFNHALIKITLFFATGVIYIMTDKEKVSELDGLGKKMPLTMGAFAIASLGMVGIPPSIGFNSKWYLLAGSFHRGSLLIMGLLLLSAMLNAGYFFPVIITAFFKKATDNMVKQRGNFEAPLSMLIPLLLLAGSTIFFGIWYNFPMSIINTAIKNIF